MPRIAYKITGYRLYSQLTEVMELKFQDFSNFFLLFTFIYVIVHYWVHTAVEK